MRFRWLAPLSLLACLPVLLAGSGTAVAVDTVTIGGVIDGSDGRAVNALIGLDLHDAQGQTLNPDGTARTAAGYGIVLNINQGKNGQPNLPPEGTSDTSTATISWSADVPANAANVYLEAYPQDQTLHTNEARYGHAMRHNVPLPPTGPIDVHLPLICAQGGTTGSIRGAATLGGSPMPLQRAVAWSMDPYDAVARPTLGWNIGTGNQDGTYTIPNLASGQRYQVWLTATDNETVKTVGVVVNPCAETAADVSFDPPPPSPGPSPSAAPAPPPPAPTVENGSSLITAGGIATLSGAADAGAQVQLLAYSRPSTTYAVIRTTTASSTGSYSFSIRPQTNTRLKVRVAGADSSTVVVGVRTAISLTVSRTALRSYRFTGRTQPLRPGQLVSVYASTVNGNVLVGRGPVGSNGIWVASHRFIGNGTFGLLAVTGADMTNAAGRSATVRTSVH